MALFSTVAMAEGETVQNPDPQPAASAHYVSSSPSAATLPAGVYRFKTGPIEGFGNSNGRDGKGKSVDNGLSADGWGAVMALSYGITDTLSVDLSTGYALTNRLGIDKNKLRKSTLYKDNYNTFVKTASKVLASTDGSPCATEAACRSFIAAGKSLPDDSNLTLPTGEILRIRKGVPLSAVADSLVLNGAKGSDGLAGLQDIDLGVLWNAVKEDWYAFAIGGGVRLPTGKFDDVAAGYRGTGRGTFDLGLKMVGDVKATDGLWISVENQMEWNLRKAKRKKTSLLDNTKTLSKEEDFERWGTKHKGSLKFSWGAGELDQRLNWLGVSLLPLKWEFNSIDVVDGKKTGAPADFTETEFGATLDGFAFGVPLQLYTYYVVPTWGRNQALVLNWAGATLSAFYKF